MEPDDDAAALAMLQKHDRDISEINRSLSNITSLLQQLVGSDENKSKLESLDGVSQLPSKSAVLTPNIVESDRETHSSAPLKSSQQPVVLNVVADPSGPVKNNLYEMTPLLSQGTPLGGNNGFLLPSPVNLSEMWPNPYSNSVKFGFIGLQKKVKDFHLPQSCTNTYDATIKLESSHKAEMKPLRQMFDTSRVMLQLVGTALENPPRNADNLDILLYHIQIISLENMRIANDRREEVIAEAAGGKEVARMYSHFRNSGITQESVQNLTNATNMVNLRLQSRVYQAQLRQVSNSRSTFPRNTTANANSDRNSGNRQQNNNSRPPIHANRDNTRPPAT